MKELMIDAAALTMAISLIGGGAKAADYWPSSFSNDVVNVAEGATDTLGSVNLLDQATLEKTGAGELVVPLANIIQQKDFKLKVSEGKVKVTAGTGGGVALSEPTDILNKAAFWLDASDAGSFVTGDDNHITHWFDKRETQTAAPFDHYLARALCYDGNTHSTFPTNATMQGLAAVDLRGVGSGAVFTFVQDTAQEDTSELLARDVFVVYCQTRNIYAFLFSGNAPSYNNMAYHPSASTISVTGGGCLMRAESAAVLDSRTWLNGVEIDPLTTKCKIESRVFGTHFMGAEASLQGIGAYEFSDKFPARNGGDGFAEVIIFTNRLTMAEHARVERYLCKKYNKTVAKTTSYTFDMAPGTEITFDGVDANSVTVTGCPKVTRTGSGDFTVDYAVGTAETKLDTLGSGKTTLKCDAAIPATAGKVLTAAEGYVGTDVTEADGTENACLVKTGIQKATLRTIPAGMHRVTAGEGILSLSAAHAATNREVYATITNWNFNGLLSGNNYNVNMKNVSKYGWQGHCWRINADWEDSYPEFIRQQGTNSEGAWIDNNWYTYKGWNAENMLENGYAALRGASALSTTITIPEAGDYELSFDWSRSSMYSRLRVMIGPDTENLKDVGCVFDIDGDMTDETRNRNNYLTWSKRTFRLNALTAGEMTLMFRSDADGVDRYRSILLFDNVVVRKLPADNAICELTGGDFECVTTNRVFANNVTASSRMFGTDYTLDDWECVQPTGYWAIAPATRGMFAASSRSGVTLKFGYYSYLLERSDRPGHSQLVMGNKDGYAQKKIALPAGTWKLMADFAPFRKTNDMGYELRQKTTAAILAATVTVGENAATSLGSISTTTAIKAEFDREWETSFTVPDGGAEVTIKLQVTSEEAGAVVDNLRLKRVVAGNLVADGDFADGAANWQMDTSMKATSDACGRVRAQVTCGISTSSGEYNNCYPHYDGATSGNFALIGDCATVYQSVNFPEAGLYRLTYYTRSRNNWKNAGEAPALSWGRNRLLAYTAADGVTNTIDIALVDTTNWVQHSAVFKIAAAGTRSFGFRGLNVPTKTSAIDGADNGYWDKAAFFDGVSITKVGTEDIYEPVSVPSDLALKVADGAKLQLGFNGTVDVGEVRLGGRRVSGAVNSENYPDYIIGPGELYVAPIPGTVITIR